MSDSTTFSIRIDNQLLERITNSADRAGETRTAYVLSWLPDAYDEPAQHPGRNTQITPNGDTQSTR